jgi:cAMP-dependent protein kinase regulator
VEVVGKDADGDELRIAELGPGDVVGEISLVLRRPANATVRALHPTVALELTRDELHKVIKAHPTLLAQLYELATQREEETRSVVAQEAFDVEDVVLL